MSSHSPRFDWNEYLYIAQELAGRRANRPGLEAKLRSAISRAYYAAFIQARNHLRDVDGERIPTSNAHRYVARKYAASSDIRRKDIGWKLANLSQIRNKADYNDVINDLPAATQRVLVRAGQIITQINNL